MVASCLAVASTNNAIDNRDMNYSTVMSSKQLNEAIHKIVLEKIETIHEEIIASQAKDSLDKNDVRDIFNEKFLNIMTSIQSEYRAAILGTNNNMALFGIVITIIALLASFYNLLLSKNLKKEAKEILNEGEETFRERIDKIEKNSRDIIQGSINNINKINYYQDILHNHINRKLATNLTNMDVKEAYADYNSLHEKVISITSLSKKIITTTLPELNVPKFEQLKKSKPMQNYLKQIREYFKDDLDLVAKIDEVIS